MLRGSTAMLHGDFPERHLISGGGYITDEEHDKNMPVLYRPPQARPQSMIETASCIVTGLLLGAFITLCVLSSQRRSHYYLTGLT
jgi:hypothetical protein